MLKIIYSNKTNNMTKYISAGFIGLCTYLVSIYSFQFNSINGNSVINMNNYQGKKILLVNTASGSEYTNQYAALEQLHQLYKDSLVIIAFPSNSFGHEPGSNADIKQFIQQNYNAHFKIAAKADVTGSNALPIFKWIAEAVQNGTMNNTVSNDFYKFLIDGNGNLIGAYTSTVSPMSNEIKNAITAP
jgi:glutathione peroxidase